MNAEAVFNRYDIRGDHPGEIDGEFSRRLGRAVGTYSLRNGRGKVVVGRDTREASEAVHPEFVAGVRDTGAGVVDVGEGTSDRTALAAGHYGGFGVMVTASHHPWERTGFKLIYERGNGFSNEDLESVKELFRSEKFESGEGTLLNEKHEFDETYRERLAEALDEHVGGGLDADVLVDTCGVAGRTAVDVFEQAGATATGYSWNGRPEPEPGEDTREEVLEEVDGFDAAVGYDPDGDRVYLVHPELGWVDGDRLFYALARVLEPGKIAASIDTSPMIEEAGAEVEYSRVGDIFVAEKGIEIDADLLGEPNGHYGFPDFCWYSSGILASLILASEAERLPRILGTVEDYRVARHTREYGSMEERDEALERVKKKVAGDYGIVSRLDGVKFEGEGFTGLVRPSGTSPKIRVVVHSRSSSVDAEELAGGLL